MYIHIYTYIYIFMCMYTYTHNETYKSLTCIHNVTQHIYASPHVNTYTRLLTSLLNIYASPHDFT